MLDGIPHKLAIRFRTGEPLPYRTDAGEQPGEFDLCIPATAINGTVDGMYGTSVRGWVFRTDFKHRRQDRRRDRGVRANGIRIGQVKADVTRNDVAEVHGCEPHCGFLYSLPPRYRDGKPFVLEFRTVPEGMPLLGSPFSGAVLSRDSRDQLNAMHAAVEQLATQVYALKDQLRQMVTADDYTIGTSTTPGRPSISTRCGRG